MTTLATTLAGASAITASTAPAMGSINPYSAAGGALTPALQALSGTNVGASCIVLKDVADTTFNTITLSTNSGDYFEDGTTSLVLFAPGDEYQIQCITVSGTKYWKVIDMSVLKRGIIASTSEFTLVSSSASSTILTTVLPAGFTASQGIYQGGYLTTGAVFRFCLMGTIQNQATSGILTFTPTIQNTALATGGMATITSANAASGFWLQTDISIRSTGTSGSAIAKTFGVAALATTGLTAITGTSTTATTINTTSTNANNTISLAAQWATNSATNSLKIETATLERIL